MQQSAASAFLRRCFVRELGAAKYAVLPDAPHQAVCLSAETYQLRGWKTALPEIPALQAQNAPDL